MAMGAIDRTAVVDLLSALVRIPSVNPRMGGGVGEQALARFLAERLQAWGVTPTVTEVQPGRPNVLGTSPGKPGGRHLLFEAHLDTVSPSHGQAGPFIPRIEGDRLYARGACDTKGSMAAILAAFGSVLPRVERSATVSVAFLMGEEMGHEGAQHLAASGFRADGAVIGEPTGLDVVVAHKGVLRWRITTVGRSAHSATPQAGVNAIGMMARVIRSLEASLNPQLETRRHPLLGPPTLSVGRIAGGREVNVVPDQCTIDLDRRVLPGETWTTVRGELEALLTSIAADVPGFQATVEPPYQEHGAMETAGDSPIVQLAIGAVRRAQGHHSVCGVSYCTDAACLSAAGIPCVVLGPGSIEQAHTSSEYVEIRQVVTAAAIYQDMMLGGGLGSAPEGAQPPTGVH
jgi:succinyl-diaminopimelate desuccinylase